MVVGHVCTRHTRTYYVLKQFELESKM